MAAELLGDDVNNNNFQQALELVFVCDCTGSMGSYIAAAQSSIRTIITGCAADGKRDVKFGLVTYRDLPPEERT